MAKPWARLEIGYLNHPKFLALTANAICLWHEGKSYCDMHHTDGLIPKDALKTFRFRGVKSVELLLQTCPMPKPDGTPYAPLWEEHVVGYKMHDYLDHNDCREEVLARMEVAAEQKETRKLRNRERQAEWRKRNALHNAPVTPVTQPPTETEIVTPTETDKEKERGAPSAPPPRMAPIHDRSHRAHAHCGRVCLHASLFGEFVRRRNTPDADTEIRDWCTRVEREWGIGGPKANLEPGDAFDFWKARYAEQWPAMGTLKPTTNRLPAWGQGA